ncbi:MAG: D-alanine--D-alanine ligase [Gammaproteobacteria bacterium]|nr:MAG: D-alanine--D-alanine ligase [Gammaproteobacteria bacterium]
MNGGFGKVAVLYGGISAEREISRQGGQAVLASLRRQGIEAQGFDPARDGSLCRLVETGCTRAFVMLHGRGGEDGVVQGALEALGLPYTGSGVLGSALAMDKYRTKRIWQAAGIPTPPARLVTDAAALEDAARAVGYPLIVKPVHEGSSIGMCRVDGPEALAPAWAAAAGADREVLLERWIEGAEYTVAILGERALPMIRLETPRTFYDFEAKYRAEDTRYLIPCGLPEAEERALAAQALAAFAAVGASGWGRVDLMVDAAGNPWFLEVNTVPGMTDHSLVPMAARAAGMDFDALVRAILETSREREEVGA